ncbi:MAG: (Fe-S)-binding protein [Alphaproteobacteria bacterium]
MNPDNPRVGLFVTCLVDIFRPSVGFAALSLLEKAGCRVDVPATQTCCGQPGYNSGSMEVAAGLAKSVIATFEPYDYVVAPSGSCAGMIRVHYPALLAGSPWGQRARHLAAKTYELTSFLVDVCKFDGGDAVFDGSVTYHDSCSSLREMGVDAQPRALLAKVKGLSLREAADRDACCGFGGTFCIKYPEISARMVGDKVAALVATGADTVLAGDMGCLLNIAGKAKREGRRIKARHVAEVLAGLAEGPAIGEGQEP